MRRDRIAHPAKQRQGINPENSWVLTVSITQIEFVHERVCATKKRGLKDLTEVEPWL